MMPLTSSVRRKFQFTGPTEKRIAKRRTGDLALLRGARLGRGGAVHLRENVVRRAERARAARELLVEGGDDRVVRSDRRDVRGKERHVVTGREVLRVERTVAPEDHRGLALRLRLLREELSLRGDLERQEDDLHAARDLRDQRREVGCLLAHRLAVDRDALGLQRRADDVGETGRVGLLVIDDHHGVTGLHAELGRHVRGVRRALDAVVRHVAEEVALVAAGRQRDTGRRAGGERQAGLLEDRRHSLNLVATRRTDHAHDRPVRRELLRNGRCERRLQLRVALDDLQLDLVRLVRVPLAHREQGPVQLIVADRRHRPGDRRHHADLHGARA
ncbi:MAG: hypothetical protein ABSB24_16845 [Gaiellaceae bacterium]